MFFVFNFQPSSQAECRRFDPGLPLQKNQQFTYTGSNLCFICAPIASPTGFSGWLTARSQLSLRSYRIYRSFLRIDYDFFAPWINTRVRRAFHCFP